MKTLALFLSLAVALVVADLASAAPRVRRVRARRAAVVRVRVAPARVVVARPDVVLNAGFGYHRAPFVSFRHFGYGFGSYVPAVGVPFAVSSYGIGLPSYGVSGSCGSVAPLAVPSIQQAPAAPVTVNQTVNQSQPAQAPTPINLGQTQQPPPATIDPAVLEALQKLQEALQKAPAPK